MHLFLRLVGEPPGFEGSYLTSPSLLPKSLRMYTSLWPLPFRPRCLEQFLLRPAFGGAGSGEEEGGKC